MSKWTVKPATLVILGVVCFLMLMIAVLPDVDLPDTAFHRGTAPVIVHNQATAAPLLVTIALDFDHADVMAIFQYGEVTVPALSVHPNFRPILLRSIRC